MRQRKDSGGKCGLTMSDSEIEPAQPEPAAANASMVKTNQNRLIL